MFANRSPILLCCTALALVFLVFLGVRNYDGNVSALLHMDVPFGEMHHVPAGLVLYTDAAYDGMLYYQVARDLPSLFLGGDTSFHSPYRFQRILLPLMVFLVSLGNADAFPYAMLIINIIASLGALALMLRMTKGHTLHAFTVVANPAILVGILYMLTEPLSLFFTVLFLFLWEQNGRKINALAMGALILSLFARETTVFLIGLLFLWSLWHKQWKQAALVVVPLLLLAAWQYFLVLRFGAVGFQANSNIIAIPFEGPLQVLRWLQESLHPYRLSSLGLLAFAFPLFLVLCREWIQKKTSIGVYAFLLSGLCVTMLSMDPHMWGAITSIGRVVTPLYPVYALYAAERDTWVERTLSCILMIVSIVAAVGIALVPHPFVIS